jgi:hypothetical protein
MERRNVGAEEAGAVGAEGGERPPRACHISQKFSSIADVESAVAAVPVTPLGDEAGALRVSPGSVGIAVRSVGRSGHPPSPRGLVVDWSRKSRSNMLRRFASLDYSPWLDHLEHGWSIVLVTLTYPSAWRDLVPTSTQAVRHLQMFRARLERACGCTIYAIWKREFQRRGAPHYHLLLPLPPAIADEPIRPFISRIWYEVVDSGDRTHLLAGTGLDWAEGLRAIDPARVARYFAGHASPSGMGRKEYQNSPPVEWAQSGAVGRFWGYWGLCPAEASAPLSFDELVEVRRVLRHVDRSRRRMRVVRVQRVDQRTGRIYTRRVRRRAVLPHLASCGLTGATLFVPDGPAFTKVLAACIRQGRSRQMSATQPMKRKGNTL